MRDNPSACLVSPRSQDNVFTRGDDHREDVPHLFIIGDPSHSSKHGGIIPRHHWLTAPSHIHHFFISYSADHHFVVTQSAIFTIRGTTLKITRAGKIKLLSLLFFHNHKQNSISKDSYPTLFQLNVQ